MIGSIKTAADIIYMSFGCTYVICIIFRRKEVSFNSSFRKLLVCLLSLPFRGTLLDPMHSALGNFSKHNISKYDTVSFPDKTLMIKVNRAK